MEFTSFAIHVLITSRLTFFMSTWPITRHSHSPTFSLKLAGKTVDLISFFSLSVKRKSEPADVPYALTPFPHTEYPEKASNTSHF